MHRKGVCCDECFAIIARKNTTAARLWLDMCESEMNDTIEVPFLLPSALRDLELLGFITTTDIMDEIHVKLHGQVNDYAESYFCGGKCGPR